MPSFDVVSELDKHEVTNAVENAVKELDRRYDLKGKGSFEFKEKDLTVNLTAEADFQLEAMIEILKLALVKRKIDVQCLEVKDAYASGKLMKQEAVLKEGIDKELAKKIVAHIKDAKLKVQAAIQGEQVRVTGKKRDDLQEAIAALRAATFDMPLQFNNFRD
ncbi:YajQ family cyclic di-GMP-binding protein [Pseudomonas sp. MYb118]|uniref:YajQ family cyclic di-GMP-binding protein n=1 Tax=Pseudomonas sp. MYb118 TaxID=1848720 RepID=UPI0034CD6A47